MPAADLSSYGFMRFGTCAPELKVADITFNTEKIIEAAEAALQNKCHFLLTPELSLTGYTCGDLFFQQSLLEQTRVAITRLAEYTKDSNSTVVVGAPIAVDGLLYNCAVFISCGEIIGIVPKTYLCNNNEYYEERWFSSEFDRKDDYIDFDGEQIPFGADLLFETLGKPGAIIGAEICEDLWTLVPPSSHMAAAGATVLLNLSASNEYLSKTKYRTNLTLNQSAKCIAAYVYSSCGPGESTTDTVFSGHCMIHENGSMLTQTERFHFDTQIAYADIDISRLVNERLKNNSYGAPNSDRRYRILSIDIPEFIDSILMRSFARSPFVPTDETKKADCCKEIFTIQSVALAKRMKHINAENVVIGISGGLDSTLALLVAVKTFELLGLDYKGIHAITMPGFGTSKRTKFNADQLMNLLAVSSRDIPINEAVEKHFEDIGHDSEIRDVVYENSQARYRTMILMDIANQTGGLVVGTGDLSEIALGWSTYNGDHMSMYGVNSGIPKTLIRHVVEWCAHEEYEGEISSIILDICDTPISPELLPTDEEGFISQETEKEIGPYELHDFFLYYVVRCHFSPSKVHFIASLVFKGDYSEKNILRWLKLFYRRFFANQYKRSCMPDGVKVGTVALSPRADWRMPSDASPDLWLAELNEIKCREY